MRKLVCGGCVSPASSFYELERNPTAGLGMTKLLRELISANLWCQRKTPTNGPEGGGGALLRKRGLAKVMGRLTSI